MSHIDLLANVRHFVQSRFQQLGASVESNTSETILVRGGFYCGRRFERDGLSATWFIAEQQLKFHDRTGAVIDVCRSPGFEASIPQAA